MLTLQALLNKYNVSGPRYTSYPPAPHFSPSVGSKEYGMALEAEFLTAGAPKDVSLYLHFPFCDTLCYFCGCTMLISNDRGRIHEYVEYLKREITLVSERLKGKQYRVTQMHWGGGSPTHLLPEEITELGDHLRASFPFHPDAEISIEVDPRGFLEAHAQALQHVGFNRASVGVQDFFPDTQWAVNRIQPYDMTASVIKLLRLHGMTSLNVDLIYGLPYQTLGTFRTTMDQVLSLKPDRLAVYNFAYVPWVKPHQKVIQIDTLPTPDRKIALMHQTIERFTQAGYEYIGMDHYAKPEDELARARREGTLHRNFQGYSTQAGALMIGLGMSSISRLSRTFAQNHKHLPQYYAAIDRGELPTEKGYELSDDDLLREEVIMQIMCQLYLDVVKLENHYPIRFREYFKESLEKLSELERDGLVEVGQNVVVTPLGKYFLRNIAMCFDAYFDKPVTADERHSVSLPVYSKTF